MEKIKRREDWMKCPVCDSKNVESKEITHKYKESGLSNITLKNITRVKCNDCGEEVLLFGNIDQLHSLIASFIIQKRSLMNHEELRFLRTYIGYSSANFAKILSVSASHYSRLEKGKSDIGPQFDRLVRFSVIQKLPNPDRNYDIHDQILTEGIDETTTKSKLVKFFLDKKIWVPEPIAC